MPEQEVIKEAPATEAPAALVEAEAAEDALLMSLDSDDEVVGISEGEEALGEETPNIADSSDDDEGEEKDEATNSPDDNADAPPTPDLEKALTALRRAKVPKSVMDNLSDEEALEWGASLAKIQGDVDETFRRKAELEKQLENAVSAEESADKSDTDDAEPEDKPSSPKREPDTDLQDFADTFGDEAADSLKSYVTPHLDQHKQALESMAGMIEGMLMRDAKARLLDRFPQLEDNETFASVSEKAEGLISSAGYDSGDLCYEALRDAARIILADADQDAKERVRRSKNRARNNGQAARPGRRKSHEGLSTSDKESAVLDMLEGGSSVEEARSAFGF